LYLITGKNLNENMCTCFGNLSQIVEMFALYFVDLEEGEYVIDVMGAGRGLLCLMPLVFLLILYNWINQ